MDLTVEQLANLYVLDGLKGFGPQKFKMLWDAQLSPAAILDDPERLPVTGNLGDKLKKHLRATSAADAETCRKRAERQIEAARKYGAVILTYWDALYPSNLLASAHPVPIIYARGNLNILKNQRTVACVGSRGIRPPYDSLHASFCRCAIDEGFAIASGFALGADTVGHRAAFEATGQTICVMPGGLDRPFPPENRDLWNSLLESESGVFVSEFAFGTAASALTLRKRNKVIIALALGVLVSQSSKKGGAMNAFRFAIEQKKPVATFAADLNEDTSGNQQIGTEMRAPTRVFNLQCSCVDGFQGWLQQLSSSI